MILIISYCFHFMHCRSTEVFNEVWSYVFLFMELVLAWMLIGGLFQAAMVSTAHVN
jgi:hypothetical protein